MEEDGGGGRGGGDGMQTIKLHVYTIFDIKTGIEMKKTTRSDFIRVWVKIVKRLFVQMF